MRTRIWVMMLLLVLCACGQAPAPDSPFSPTVAPTFTATPTTAPPFTPSPAPAPTTTAPSIIVPTLSLPAAPPFTPGVSPEITAWLLRTALPFTTTDPNAPPTDLSALAPVIGDARIVALGEATHGTHEFFQMKHRLLEYLVEQQGFRVFAIEDQWGEVQALNSYIQSGTGNRDAAFRALLAVWQTQEVDALLTWMRNYNARADPAQSLSFVGIDMQSPDRAITYLLDYLRNVAPNDVPPIESALDCVRGKGAGYRSQPEDAKARCHQTLQTTYDSIATHRVRYAQGSSSAAFVQALHAARVALEATELYATTNDDTLISTRDRLMAENVQWIADEAAPQAKIVVWAHNWHVRTGACVGMDGVRCTKSMGMYLRQGYGSRLVAVGFDFYGGTFRTLSEVYTVLPPPPDSYVYAYNTTNLPRFVLDTRHLPPGTPIARWLADAHPMRDIGLEYNANDPSYYFEQVRLPEAFDVIIYLQQTTAALR